MSKIKLTGNASGTGVLTVTAPNTNTDRTISLPDTTDTLAVNSDVTNKLPLAGGTMSGNLIVNASVNAAGSGTGGGFHFADGNAMIYRDTNDMVFKLQGAEKIRLPSSGGITFNGDTAAANALDDYEEGTWTPTLTCTNSGSYTLQGAADLCAYTKVGRVVHIQGSISINGESSPNGNLRITLPLTAFTGTDDTDYSMGNLAIGNHGGSYPSNINAFVQSGAYFYPWGVNDNGTTFYLSDSVVDTNFQIHFNFSYITSA